MPAERQIPIASRGRSDARPEERWISDLAAVQHGIVGRVQLLEAGFSESAVERRIRDGRLHPLHAGVYAVGHPHVSTHGRWMAGVLAAGGEGALTHRSAGALWGFCLEPAAFVETTSPGRHDRRAGLRPHRGRLAPDEVTVKDGIPVATVERTIIDIAAVLPHDLRRVLDQAEVLGLLDVPALRALMKRHRGRRGIARLRLALDQLEAAGANLTRSELEERFLAFLDRAGIRRPQTNTSLRARGRWFEVDCFWRQEGVVVELDGYKVHGTRRAFEADRKKIRKLQAAGLGAVAVTWRQIRDEPDDLEGDLRALLRRRASDNPRQAMEI